METTVVASVRHTPLLITRAGDYSIFSEKRTPGRFAFGSCIGEGGAGDVQEDIAEFSRCMIFVLSVIVARHRRLICVRVHRLRLEPQGGPRKKTAKEKAEGKKKKKAKEKEERARKKAKIIDTGVRWTAEEDVTLLEQWGQNGHEVSQSICFLRKTTVRTVRCAPARVRLADHVWYGCSPTLGRIGVAVYLLVYLVPADILATMAKKVPDLTPLAYSFRGVLP